MSAIEESPVPLGTLDALARFAGESVRLLRAVRVPEGRLCEPEGSTVVLAVLDTETTGFDPAEDKIVELAIRRVRIDVAGGIVEIGRGQSWLEDPGHPLDPNVARLTGISDADLAAQRIDERVATGMLRSADLVCAHNSAFDRPFIERRLPEAAGARWCCSCADVDWPARGLDGRGLGWLLSQLGLCHAGHRAMNDVDAVVALLAAEHDGRSSFSEMLENAVAPAWVVDAVGASFDVKDALRRRGYHWHRALKVWRREVPDRERQGEKFWLARHIYADNARPQALGPRIAPVDPAYRFL